MTVQSDPAAIVETAESFVIDATEEEFNVTMRGINAGREEISLDWWMIGLSFQFELPDLVT